jgi:hypothetical protein
MVAIVLFAIAMAAVTLPELTGGNRLLLGSLAIALMVFQCAQRSLARIPAKHPAIVSVLGVISSLMAISMFILLFILGLVLPQGAALLSVIMLIFVAYLTTWD